MRRALQCQEIAAPSVAAALAEWNALATRLGVGEDDLVSVNALPAPPAYPIQFVDGDTTRLNQVVVVFVYHRGTAT